MTGQQSTRPVTLREALDSVKMQGDTGQFECFADWAQGRTGFGGLSAAAALRAMRSKIADERKLRSLMVSFVGPISIGKADIQLLVLREGRSASQVEVKILQEGTVRLVALACFGQDRASAIQHAKRIPLDIPALEDCRKIPYAAGLSPQFTEALDFRYTHGEFPLSGAEGHQLGGYFCFDCTDSVSAEELMILLSDAWPPAKLQSFSTLAPISTVSWSLELTSAVTTELGGYWYLLSEAEASDSGYSQQRSHLYSPSGELVAINQQTVALFA